MTRDLEETLTELGPGYRELVLKLKAAHEPFDAFPSRPAVRRGKLRTVCGYLMAASIAAALAFAALLMSDSARAIGGAKEWHLAYAGRDAIGEIVRTQNPDGSWGAGNDVLTRQNAAVLRLADCESIAYKKATRYLRSRGLRPFSDEELREREERFRVSRPGGLTA